MQSHQASSSLPQKPHHPTLLSPNLDFIIDKVKQLYVEGETIDKERTITIRFPEYNVDPTQERYFDNSHTYQFICHDYLYIFMGSTIWHSFNTVVNDYCLFRIHLNEINNLYEQSEKIAVEEVKTFDGCYGGRIFPACYYDDDLKYVFLYGGLKQGRILSNEFYGLDMTTFKWKRYISYSSFVPPLEGHCLIKRRNGEYYSYGGHGGNLIFTNSFYRILLNHENSQIEFQDMKLVEKMNGYEHVTSTIAYHQCLYFEKIDAMIVFGGKLRSGDNAPMTNDLLIFYFKTNTWIKVESYALPSSSPLPMVKKIPDEYRVMSRNLWVKTPKTRSHNMVKISPTKLLSFGGTCNTRDHPEDFTRDVLIFDVEELTWQVCDSLSNYNPNVEYLVDIKHSMAQSDESCLEGVGQIFRQAKEDDEELKELLNTNSNASSSTSAMSKIHEIDISQFDETFVGRNYFSMCLDYNRNCVYMFGGSTCSKNGSRKWESSSLVKFHFQIRPTILKSFKLMKCNSHQFSDMLIKTLE